MSASLIVASLSRKIQDKRNQKVLTKTRRQKLKTKLSKSIEFNLGFSLQQSSSKTNVQLSFKTGGQSLLGCHINNSIKLQVAQIYIQVHLIFYFVIVECIPYFNSVN